MRRIAQLGTLPSFQQSKVRIPAESKDTFSIAQTVATWPWKAKRNLSKGFHPVSVTPESRPDLVIRTRHMHSASGVPIS